MTKYPQLSNSALHQLPKPAGLECLQTKTGVLLILALECDQRRTQLCAPTKKHIASPLYYLSTVNETVVKRTCSNERTKFIRQISYKVMFEPRFSKYCFKFFCVC